MNWNGCPFLFRIRSAAVGVVIGGLPVLTTAQVSAVSEAQPQRVFAAEQRKIAVTWRNSGDHVASLDLRTRIYQASSATAAPLREASWKELTVLPRQTILEQAAFDFPAVRAETRFLIQWLDATDKVLGLTEVWVYPPDLLRPLKTLAGDAPLGIFDPQDELKPLVRALGIDFMDLEDSGMGDFRGKLAIIGPFEDRTQMPAGLPHSIKTLANRGVAVVWIQPPPDRTAEPMPSFYVLPPGKGAVVIAQAATVANLATQPESQLNLLHFAKLARFPCTPRLPDFTYDP